MQIAVLFRGGICLCTCGGYMFLPGCSPVGIPLRYDVCYKYVGVGTGFWVVPLFANWFMISLPEI